MLTISRLTDEYVRVAVRDVVAGVQVDPTSYTASLAFIGPDKPNIQPQSGDFAAAAWEIDTSTTPNRYYLRRKATTLVRGAYTVWVKIATGSETVIEPAGPMKVT